MDIKTLELKNISSHRSSAILSLATDRQAWWIETWKPIYGLAQDFGISGPLAMYLAMNILTHWSLED